MSQCFVGLLMISFQSHLAEALGERMFYNNEITLARQENICEFILHCILMLIVCLGFDFAEAVRIPYDPEQPSYYYFLSEFACHLFGIADLASKWQMNYVVPEHQLPLVDGKSNKGALLTANLLLNYVNTHANGRTTASFHADNCVAQNKNNLIMQLMVYFIIIGKLQEISVNFMIPGHTKFMPDGFFGLLKRKLKKHHCDSWKQIPKLIEQSSIAEKKNKAKTYGSRMNQFQYYNLKAHFNGWFKEIPDITSYQHFQFSSLNPGFIFTHMQHNGPEIMHDMRSKKWKSMSFIQVCLELSQDPDLLTIAPLSQDRKKYLQEKVLCHIHDYGNTQHKDDLLEAIV